MLFTTVYVLEILLKRNLVSFVTAFKIILYFHHKIFES